LFKAFDLSEVSKSWFSLSLTFGKSNLQEPIAYYYFIKKSFLNFERFEPRHSYKNI